MTAACLRPLRERDLDELLVVQEHGAIAGLANIFPQDTHPFPADEIRRRWTVELVDPEVDCFAIVHKDRLSGFAATRGDEFFHFGTAVDTWGTGLAARAHDEVLDHLREQRFRRAWLRVFDENTRAVRFYLRRGWVAADITTRTSYPPHPVLRRYEIDLCP